MGLFLHLLDKGFDTLCQGMVRWQMIGKLVLDLAALTACGCFLLPHPAKAVIRTARQAAVITFIIFLVFIVFLLVPHWQGRCILYP